jgi:phage shock protein PspC (stress-responsive transcriptional regulator)
MTRLLRLLAAALGFVAAPVVLLVLYRFVWFIQFVQEPDYRWLKPSRKPRRVY